MAYEAGKSDRLIETGRVAVTRWTLAPGHSTGRHRHEHDYVVVPVSGGALTVVASAGQSRQMQQMAGEPYVGAAGVEHEVVGADSHDVVFVEIELLP